MGMHIPHSDMMGVDDLHTTWASCPMDCSPLFLVDLNIDLRDQWTEWEEAIADFLNDINVVDMS